MTYFRVFSLAKRGASTRDLVCDEDGVMLGSAQLVKSMYDSAGRPTYHAVSAGDLSAILTAAYGPSFDLELPYRANAIQVIARALNERRLTEATIGALHLRLPRLTAQGAECLSRLNKYHPDQPRDWHGRWTFEGGGSRSSETEQTTGPIIASLGSLNRCIEECYELLNRPLPYKWSDLARYDFLRCVSECRQRYQ